MAKITDIKFEINEQPYIVHVMAIALENILQTTKSIARLIAEKKCTFEDCGGTLRQSRSGSKVVYCTVCNHRYIATSKKKK